MKNGRPTPDDWRRLDRYDTNTFLLAVFLFVVVPGLVVGALLF